ncbi:MAG: hypothetical protein ACR2L1_04610 [Pyrinomonadaceae bacterium]
MNLIDYLEKVEDKVTFIEFVNALIEERSQAERIEQQGIEKYKSGTALGWHNTNLEGFLQSALVWLVDSGKDEISWKLMAEFLYSGKIYE